jgi:hypothetical protein
MVNGEVLIGTTECLTPPSLPPSAELRVVVIVHRMFTRAKSNGTQIRNVESQICSYYVRYCVKFEVYTVMVMMRIHLIRYGAS